MNVDTKGTAPAYDAKSTLTTEVEFDYIPADEVNILAVRSGVSAQWALSNAQCIDEAVKELLADAVQNRMSESVAWLCRFAMDAAGAMRSAAGVEV